MCFFKFVKFELYPEQTRLHPGYQKQEEDITTYRARASLKRAIQNYRNRQQNKKHEAKIDPKWAQHKEYKGHEEHELKVAEG